jgi:S1-C subfamily serine protease
MVFGLVSLLVVLGVCMWIFNNFEYKDIKTGQKAQQEAEQISGRDANGVPAMNSYKAEAYAPNGTFKGITITDLTPDGPMDKYYGLKVGDIVLQIGGLDVAALSDYGAAKGQLDEAYQKAAELTVQRDTAKITLPVGGAKSPLDQLNIPMH